jgi:transcription-repair coupling factor (superfamily II helicase)
VMGFHNNTPNNAAGLMHYISVKAGTVKLRPDQKLFFPRGWTSAEQRINGTRNILKELMNL